MKKEQWAEIYPRVTQGAMYAYQDYLKSTLGVPLDAIWFRAAELAGESDIFRKHVEQAINELT